MESQIRLVLQRLKLGNHDLNKSDKYLDYFQDGDGFYEKIGNKLDDFLRVSYYNLQWNNQLQQKNFNVV